MNTEAIERIKGFCCEVDEKQWKELVRVAHDNGVNPSAGDKWDEHYPVFFIDDDTKHVDAYSSIEIAAKSGYVSIPYPDFLAKLKGEEKWAPKAGEMVEVKRRNSDWEYGRFVAIDSESGRDWYVCYLPDIREYHAFEMGLIRKSIPTITRTEAESLLNKRIID